MSDLQLEAIINGKKIKRNAKPSQRLLDFLRDDLNLTGNKEGCGAGECGTCSVFVDGVLMKSCLLPVASIGVADRYSHGLQNVALSRADATPGCTARRRRGPHA